MLLLRFSPASHCKLCNYAEPKPFSWAKPAFFFHFSSSNLSVHGHILLITAGDALSINPKPWDPSKNTIKLCVEKLSKFLALPVDIEKWFLIGRENPQTVAIWSYAIFDEFSLKKNRWRPLFLHSISSLSLSLSSLLSLPRLSSLSLIFFFFAFFSLSSLVVCVFCK